MRTVNLADRDCGMNHQIATLLHALSVAEMDVPDCVWIETMPYGNCRERGFVLSIDGLGESRHNLAFFEHRNSDHICALFWEGMPHVSRVIRYDDIPEGVFPDKWTHDAVFDYMDIRGAVELVRSTLRRLIEAHAKAEG